MFEKIHANIYPKKLITSMIKKNKLIHTIILSGDKGSGKLTFAKEIAKQITYNNNNKSIENYIDINIIDGESTGSISVDSIRKIRNMLHTTPHECEKKVQIIANCEQMTIPAQNALLKSLEEPSPSTIFILTTSNIHKLLDTIISRAVVINIEKIPESEAIKILSSEYPQSNTSDIIRYVKIFNGNIGLIKKIINSPDKEASLNLCEDLLFYIITNNEYEIMKILSKYKTNKSGAIFFLELFKIYFSKILNLYLLNKTLSSVLKNHHLQYFTSLESKIYISDLTSQALEYLSSNVNLGLVLTWLNINLSHHHIM